MLPYSDDPYLLRLEEPSGCGVTLPVPPNLRFPKRAANSRHVPAARAAMPEAPVDENRGFLPMEVEIRSTRYRRYMHGPSADALPHELHPEPHLGRAVPPATDRSHMPRTSCRNAPKFSAGQRLAQRSLHRYIFSQRKDRRLRRKSVGPIPANSAAFPGELLTLCQTPDAMSCLWWRVAGVSVTASVLPDQRLSILEPLPGADMRLDIDNPKGARTLMTVGSPATGC